MDIGAFILSFVLQMVFTLGFVFLFGKVIALCNGAFYRNFGSKGRAGLLCHGLHRHARARGVARPDVPDFRA